MQDMHRAADWHARANAFKPPLSCKTTLCSPDQDLAFQPFLPSRRLGQRNASAYDVVTTHAPASAAAAVHASDDRLYMGANTKTLCMHH